MHFISSLLCSLLVTGTQAWAQDPGVEQEGDADPLRVEAPSPLTMSQETYVLGNTFVTLYHELGHALVDIKGLPVLGREEDAVDAFALVELIIQLRQQDKTDSERQELIDFGYASVDQWLKLSFEDGEPVLDDYYGPHGLNRQRMFQTACMLLGASASNFAHMAETFQIPDVYLTGCKRSFFDAYDGWIYLLDTLGTLQGEDDDRSDLIFEILPAAREQHRRWENLIRETDILQRVQRHFSTSFSLEEPIRVTFESCEEENAFYFPIDRSISMCYELLNSYARLYNQNTETLLNQEGSSSFLPWSR